MNDERVSRRGGRLSRPKSKVVVHAASLPDLRVRHPMRSIARTPDVVQENERLFDPGRYCFTIW
jgi:hypothetical protein